MNHNRFDGFNIEKVISFDNKFHDFFLELFYEDIKIPFDILLSVDFDWTKENEVEVENTREDNLRMPIDFVESIPNAEKDLEIDIEK